MLWWWRQRITTFSEFRISDGGMPGVIHPVDSVRVIRCFGIMWCCVDERDEPHRRQITFGRFARATYSGQPARIGWPVPLPIFAAIASSASGTMSFGRFSFTVNVSFPPSAIR